MKITIIAVGKLKEKFWKDAVAEYSKRLSNINLQIVEVNDIAAQNPEIEKEKEAELINLKIPENSYKIALAIQGRQYSSEQVASHFQDLTLLGKSNFCFIIGGSCGLSDSILQQCDELISFGKITLPHNLARVVLVEQIYRCWKIAHGQSYHK